MSDRFQRSRVPVLPTVLFADASEDYRSMARDALLEGRNATDLRTVADADRKCSRTSSARVRPRARSRRAPSLIVIDADLPGAPGGHELIRALKADPSTKRIPIVALGADDDPRDGRGGL